MRARSLGMIFIFTGCLNAGHPANSGLGTASGASFGTGSPPSQFSFNFASTEIVLSAASRAAPSNGRNPITTFGDGDLGFASINGLFYVFGADATGVIDTLTASNLDQFATLWQQIPVTLPQGLKSNPGSFDRDYAGGGPVYYDAANSLIILMYHGEYWPNAPSHWPYYPGLGIAVSKDGGQSFQRLGQVIATHAPFVSGSSNNCNLEIGSGTLVPEPDGYFYTYYTDMNPNCWSLDMAVARAKISDVVNAAVQGVLPNHSLWQKYDNGAFTEAASPTSFGAGGGAYTPLFSYGSNAWPNFPSVAYNAFLQQYIMVHAVGSGGGIALRTSADGIRWSSPQTVSNSSTAYYPSLVNSSGGDPNILGKTFSVYDVDPFSPDWSTANLNRIQVNISVP